MIRSAALNRQRDNIARTAFALLLCLLLNIAHKHRRIASRFVLDRADKLLLGLLRGKTCRLLQLFHSALNKLLRRLKLLLNILFFLCAAFLTSLQRIELLFKLLFPLDKSLFVL